ncbi:MAG: glycosyltransferase [Sedimentisphaerales bacterium]|jgi:glycosyltransferase involved in cell wall biosynthesis
MAFISIVIPVYNEAKCLNDLTSRLFNLEKGVDDNFEYIFVNDGSSDESGEILRTLEKNKANVKYISAIRFIDSSDSPKKVLMTAGVNQFEYQFK